MHHPGVDEHPFPLLQLVLDWVRCILVIDVSNPPLQHQPEKKLRVPMGGDHTGRIIPQMMLQSEDRNAWIKVDRMLQAVCIWVGKVLRHKYAPVIWHDYFRFRQYHFFSNRSVYSIIMAC